MPAIVRSGQFLLHPRVSGVHDGARREMKRFRAGIDKNIPEVGLAEAVSGLVQSDRLDIDREVGVNPPWECVVVIGLPEGNISFPVAVDVSICEWIEN